MIFSGNKDGNEGQNLLADLERRRHEGELQRTIVGPGMTILGDLYSPGEIEVHGSVQGVIVCRDLTLGREPQVTSEITADSVTIQGRFTGQIQARRVVLTKTAIVDGEIRHSSLEIESGASVEGDIRHVAPDDLPSYEDWFVDEDEWLAEQQADNPD